MDLREYLFRKRIKITALAKIAGVDRSYLNNIVNKKKMPSVEVAKKISKATNGEVSILELLGLEEEKKD